MSTNGRDLSPKETMDVLGGMAEEDARREQKEIARVEAMTREERQSFLRSEGVDVEAVRRRTAALRARLAPLPGSNDAKARTPAEEGPSTADAEARPVVIAKAPDPEPGATPLTLARRRPELTWVIAAAAAAAVAGGAVAAAHYMHHDEPPTPEPPEDKHEPAPPAPKPDDPLALAANLRQTATAACEAKDWSACLASLDAARDKDPAGDGAPEWRRLRELATAGIARDEKKRKVDAG